MKKLLYATDFSENAEKAFVYALKIAQKHNADLSMLHVFDVLTGWNYPSIPIEDAIKIERQIIRETENKLKELFDQYTKKKDKDIKVNYIAAENKSVVKGILSIIEKNKPELVVIGTRGSSRVREIIAGSTTQSLIRQSPCPVLAIPENATDRDFKKILYATDFYEDDLVAIQQLIAFVQLFDPEIIITHISTHNEYKGNEKMEWFKELVREKVVYDNMKFELSLSDNIYERLNSSINQYKIDLLVMLEKERNGVLDKWFHHDLVKKMEFHTSTPLLSFNEHYLHVLNEENIKS